MVEKKFYSDVRFVRIENLRGRAKEIANKQELTEGLGILKVSIDSIPQYEITKVVGDPLIALKQLALEDGISEEILSKAMENLNKQ